MLEDDRKVGAIGVFRSAGWRDGTMANFFAGVRGGQKHDQCLKPVSWGRRRLSEKGAYRDFFHSRAHRYSDNAVAVTICFLTGR